MCQWGKEKEEEEEEKRLWWLSQVSQMNGGSSAAIYQMQLSLSFFLTSKRASAMTRRQQQSRGRWLRCDAGVWAVGRTETDEHLWFFRSYLHNLLKEARRLAGHTQHVIIWHPRAPSHTSCPLGARCNRSAWLQRNKEAFSSFSLIKMNAVTPWQPPGT